MSDNQESRILKLQIPNKKQLHASYMSYVKTGGLFIETNNKYALGDEVFILLQLFIC